MSVNTLVLPWTRFSSPALFCVSLAAVSVVGGCGGTVIPGGDSDPNNGMGSGSAFLRADIDGTAWEANTSLMGPGVGHAAEGQYLITGPSSVGSYIMSINLNNIFGPDTYALGVGTSVAGGTAVVALSTGGWATPLTGVAGTITITDVSDTRLVGSFSFNADASTGGATGTLEVTAGEFDLPVNNTVPTGSTTGNGGSVVTAAINGTPFSASAVSADYSVSRQFLVIVAGTATQSLRFSFGAMHGPDTYELSAELPVNVMSFPGIASDLSDCCWATNNNGGSGQVVITSMTESRLVGSFGATMEPGIVGAATGTLTVVGDLNIAILTTP